MPAPDPLALLVAGAYPDPDGGARLGAETRTLVIEDSLDGDEADLVAATGIDRRVAVISDPDTAAALGDRVARALASRFTVQAVGLDRAPRATSETAARLRAAIDARTDAIIAVGSGTINDLAKLIAFERGIPQLVFATAPSMNGYTSVSASLVEGGVKRSIRTATPIAAFFDLRVLAAAPPRLIHAGLGDSVCRSTAQVDWLLAHLLLGRPYREAPFALLRDDEAALLADPRALVDGDRRAMRHLVRTLVLSGFGMTICGGSYPASQGEHLLAHAVAMLRRPDQPDLVGAFHGEEIGVCTLAMARLHDQVLARDRPPVLGPSRVRREDVIERFGAEAGEACWRELEPKLLDRARADELNARLARDWSTIRDRLAAVALGATRLRHVLIEAGAPTEIAALGWPPPLYDEARRHAREIRNRYTFLDLIADAA
jgi:glycerol-1-phosphate dehydrogenase [NAD(P)+]